MLETDTADRDDATPSGTDGMAAEPHRGMGALPHEGGTAFRVWAPNAEAVFVTGSFNEWSDDAHPMAAEENGVWYADIEGVEPGAEYRFRITGPHGEFSRIDPYAREVTNSVGNGVVPDPHYDWGDTAFEMPDWNRLVIYELHIGTFNRDGIDGEVGTFDSATARFEHLKALGVNAIQIMPTAEFAGDLSWGYNPAHIFAVESAYGGPRAFKDFVRTAHDNGFAVILDVVYNHFGPSDIDLWQFDGWSENDKGGIYFYNDDRAATPWGDTRPDYGRPEVRQFIRDNALYWLEEFRIDGLRFDMTLYIRNYAGDESDADHNPDGFSLKQWINDEVRGHFPKAITIAEDLRSRDTITAATADGGAGFGAQWDAEFVHPVRDVLIASEDDARDMAQIEHALTCAYNGDPFQRVVYTESHDEVANGKARIPAEVDGEDQSGWAAQKRATLGAALVMTAPGIPMIFQGQEFLQGDWFDDSVPLDWSQAEEFQGIVKLWRDLIDLRLDREGGAGGLAGRGIEILTCDHDTKCIAFRRYEEDGDDGVIVVMNFRATAQDVTFDIHTGGIWRLRANTDWAGYSKDFGGHESGDLPVSEVAGGLSARVSVGPYTALIFTR